MIGVLTLARDIAEHGVIEYGRYGGDYEGLMVNRRDGPVVTLDDVRMIAKLADDMVRDTATAVRESGIYRSDGDDLADAGHVIDVMQQLQARVAASSA